MDSNIERIKASSNIVEYLEVEGGEWKCLLLQEVFGVGSTLIDYCSSKTFIHKYRKWESNKSKEVILNKEVVFYRWNPEEFNSLKRAINDCIFNHYQQNKDK